MTTSRNDLTCPRTLKATLLALVLVTTVGGRAAEASAITYFAAAEAGGIAGLAIGGPVGAAIGGAGGLVVGSLCYLFEPPDLINYPLRADPPLLTYTLPIASDWSPTLNARGQAVVNDASLLIQTGKAIKQTKDRLSGAQLVGTPTDVSNQRLWLSEYKALARAQSANFTATIDSFLTLLSSEQPAVANATFGLPDLTTARDNAASHIFAPIITDLIAFYDIDPDFPAILGDRVGAFTDAALAAGVPLTYSQMLRQTAGNCAACVPEPATIVLSTFGLVSCLWRRRGSRRSSL